MMQLEKSLCHLADGSICKDNITIEVKEADGTAAWYVDAKASAALDENCGAELYVSVPDLEGWTANYRSCEYWCTPAFGTAFTTVPNQTQGLIYRKKDGSFGVILPVVSEQYKCELKGNEDGTLAIRLFSWYAGMTECQALAVMTAEGEDPYALLKSCVSRALALLGTGVRTREERRYPEIFEYLGWCTWDAMQIRVNEEGILQKCEEFQKKNIPVRWTIIDDMWATVKHFYGKTYDAFLEMVGMMHASPLDDIEADPIRFPNGLRGCIDKVKAYGLKVGMWHPTTGYWHGLVSDSAAVSAVGRENLIEATDSDRPEKGTYLIHSWEEDKAYRFYSRFHDFLRSCGAEFIKIDNQSMTHRYYKGLAPVGTAARGFHRGMEASVGSHFDNAMINCMGTASEDMWNRSVSPISRCSNDFVPEDAAWFRRHITQCAYNCLFQGQFYYCDWDMWWTDDGQAKKNSVIRAVSGGPIYVSDKAERSNRDVLMPLVLEDGRILRCDRPGMPTADCLTSDPFTSGALFKIQNICGEAGVLAAFHLNDEGASVKGTVSPKDIPGLQGESFAVYEHFSRTVQILRAEESLDLELQDASDFRLYIFAPIRDGFAVIGRTDKFISPKTVASCHGRKVFLVEDGEYATVEDGQLVFHP